MTVLLQSLAFVMIGISVILNRYSLELLRQRMDYLEKEMNQHASEDD